MKAPLKLKFVEYKLKPYIDLFVKFDDDKIKKILLHPLNRFALNFLEEALKHKPQVEFYAYGSEPELTSKVALLSPKTSIDAAFLFLQNAKELSAELMKFIDIDHGIIIAPKTRYYFKNMPLFIISIPKSGTHLLYNLAQTFGYIPEGNCPENPQGGKWYFLDSMNSHTSTSFLNFNKSSYNLYHPFVTNPAIFIYRNPMDILVSEANFYHKDGKTAFWSYLDGLTFEERLLKLIDDPWFLGNIRERIKNYISWLDIKNVIPVSYEELVGAEGGGSRNLQIMLIWSLQLKLQIPGNPEYFAKKLYDKDSPTFHQGRIGSFKKNFTKKTYEKFYNLPQDFMEYIGYNLDYQKDDNLIPKRTTEFRIRHLIYSEANFENKPILFEGNYLDHKIMKYNSRYYGIPDYLRLNLESQARITLCLLTSDAILLKLKQKIITRRKISAFLWKLFWYLYFGVGILFKRIFKR